MKQLIYPLAFLLGLILPLQAAISNQLKEHLGDSTILAALTSFAVGTVTLTIAAFIFREKLPEYSQLTQVKPWMLIGGFLGSSLLCGTIILAPKIGSAAMMSLIVSGQIIASIVFDATGFLGTPVKVELGANSRGDIGDIRRYPSKLS
ncbi:MAG TPA: DMT family transporter [Mucilaginibacter sp.]|jgi:transporter family-2 protein|nr:DMT family transporter [Mucilaginibacter sp.]